jgi:uncharacterized protein YkwD
MFGRWLAFVAAIGSVTACTGSAHVGLPQTTPNTAKAPPPRFEAEAHGWQRETRSPRAPSDAVGDRELGEACGRRDSALEAVAAWLAALGPDEPFPEVAAMTYGLRRHGVPYVWPRAWVLAGGSARSGADVPLQRWLATFPPQGDRRCGVVTMRAAGREVVVALVSDVLADFEPLPTVVGIGAWLDLRVRLLVPASKVEVVVLGPRGRPFTVPSTKEGDLVRARFRADRPGTWLVQTMASVSGGPRPVAEALVHADVAPLPDFAATPAPGEEAGASAADAPGAILLMLNAARKTEGAPPLQRDAKLDALADEHARAMNAAQRVAHDLGDGDPGARVRAAGLDVAAAGENVAHALDAARAHRALWASPSHRENLLLDRFDNVGIGVARDEDGTVWVCELFADAHQP